MDGHERGQKAPFANMRTGLKYKNVFSFYLLAERALKKEGTQSSSVTCAMSPLATLK